MTDRDGEDQAFVDAISEWPDIDDGPPTLTDFLLARIAEDEHLANVATFTHHDWTAHAMDDVAGCTVYDDQWRLVDVCWYDHNNPLSARPDATGPAYINSDRLAEHIARHDPARVLAECEAKRRIIELAEENDQTDWYGEPSGPDLARVLKLLALPYADHPDYRDEWRP